MKGYFTIGSFTAHKRIAKQLKVVPVQVPAKKENKTQKQVRVKVVPNPVSRVRDMALKERAVYLEILQNNKGYTVRKHYGIPRKNGTIGNGTTRYLGCHESWQELQNKITVGYFGRFDGIIYKLKKNNPYYVS